MRRLTARSEFDEIDPAERAHSMLKTLVVADEDEATVSTILRHYDAALDGEISQENKFADMDKRREACLVMQQLVDKMGGAE